MLPTSGSETTESELIALNIRTVDAEQRATPSDIEFLATVLADDLVFRRADRTIVDKTTFLQSVPASAQRLKERRAVNVEAHVLGRSALVTLTVVGQADVEGRHEVRAFKNIRFFVECNGPWLLQHWYNEVDSAAPAAK